MAVSPQATVTPPPQRAVPAEPPAPTASAAPGFVQRHPVLSYYGLTFAISWGGILLLVGGPSGLPGNPEQFERLFPFAIAVALLGPSVSGLLMTGLVDGRSGYRNLLAHMLKWRVGIGWYAIALLAAPLIFAAVAFGLSVTSPVYLPTIVTAGDKTALLLPGLVAGVMVGILEELGWTGFAIPRLRSHYSVLATGVIVGVLWGAWHLLFQDLWPASVIAGGLPLALFVALNGFSFLVGQLPAYRVLMVWVYDRTGSLLVAMLMHASLTACSFILGTTTTGLNLLTYGFVLGAAWWVVVAVAAVARGGLLARQPLRPRTA